jgi:hypothetical protein
MRVQEMREVLVKYYGEKKVSTWHDNQILAIYYKMLERITKLNLNKKQ